MLSAYEYALRDPDTRVRQYLIRAMGNSGMAEFSATIQSALEEPREAVVADAVYAGCQGGGAGYQLYFHFHPRWHAPPGHVGPEDGCSQRDSRRIPANPDAHTGAADL